MGCRYCERLECCRVSSICNSVSQFNVTFSRQSFQSSAVSHVLYVYFCFFLICFAVTMLLFFLIILQFNWVFLCLNFLMMCLCDFISLCYFHCHSVSWKYLTCIQKLAGSQFSLPFNRGCDGSLLGWVSVGMGSIYQEGGLWVWNEKE